MDGVDGTRGDNGSGFAFGCNGDLAFKGNVQIETQDGGDGGNGEGGPNTTGGDGGFGGDLLIQAFGDLSFTDQAPGLIPNQFFAGHGGLGGNSVSDEPPQDPSPAVAPGSTAEAGWGGNGGAIRIEALNVLSFAEGSFFASPGSGGEGGRAEATAADGVDGSERDGPAQIGGPAAATGGVGGDAPGFLYLALDNIVGEQNIVFDDFADAGDGGESDAWAGSGGDGESEGSPEDNALKDGAKGGEVTSFAGDGGNAGSGRGGNGGLAIFRDGRGGDGWIDCRLPQDLNGGNGGMGGDSSGGAGAGGAGLNAGSEGTGDTYDVSNGGDGGDGEPTRGDGGAAGVDGIAGAKTEQGAGSFEDGNPGGPCKGGTYIISVSVVEDLDNHAQFLGIPLSGEFDVMVTLPGEGETLGEITVQGPSGWPPLTGSWNPETQEISLSGVGTVGGGSYPGVTFDWDGRLTCENVIFGDLVLDNFPSGFDNPIRLTGAGNMLSSSPPAGVGARQALAPTECVSPPA